MAKGKKDVKGKGPARKDFKTSHPHLFKKTSRKIGIGQGLKPTRDLSRVVKWPRYIRLQRQRAILNKRLKIPPAINLFSKTLDKNQAATLFGLLAKYRPESVSEKKARLVAAAASEVKGDVKDASKKPKVLKYGLNHITSLIEKKKASLVVIAHDVDPIELVVWLPALCRKQDIPYCIVKGKARLGSLVHKKTATAVVLTDVKKEDAPKLESILQNVRVLYNDSYEADRKKWGGGVMGFKARGAQEKFRKAALAQATGKI